MTDNALQDHLMTGMEDGVKVHDFAMQQEYPIRPLNISPPVIVVQPPESTSKPPDDPVRGSQADTSPSDKVVNSKAKASSPSPSRKTDLPYATFYSPRWNLSQNAVPPPKSFEPHQAHWSDGVLGSGQEDKGHTRRETRGSDTSMSAYST